VGKVFGARLLRWITGSFIIVEGFCELFKRLKVRAFPAIFRWFPPRRGVERTCPKIRPSNRLAEPLIRFSSDDALAFLTVLMEIQ